MERIYTLFLLLLAFSPTLVSAEKGKSAWWSTPLIVVVYLGFFLLAAALALCIRRYRERHLHLDQLNSLRTRAVPGLDAEEIESLPSLRFSEIKMHRLEKGDHQQQVECTVCLNEFKDQEVLRILPDCYHVFHPHCIAPWLASHFTCPVCSSPALVSAEKEKSWGSSTPVMTVVYIGCFLFAAALVLCVRQCRDRRLLLQHYIVRRMGATAHGLDAVEIESIPLRRFSEIKMLRFDNGDQQLQCVVCLNEFKDQEELRILPKCSHVFHPHCIAPWLASHLTCPVCRYRTY